MNEIVALEDISKYLKTSSNGWKPKRRQTEADKVPEETLKVLAIFNKITPTTVNGFISQILSINVLENPDEETVDPKDGGRMKPIIDAVMTKFKDIRTEGLFIKIYSHLVASLMSEWRGRQKTVFKRLLLETVENHFKSYLDSELSEDTEMKDRQVKPCINLLTMLFTVSTYKNENIIPIHIAFKALYMFTGQELNKLVVFNDGLFRCYDIMKGHPLFEKFFKRLIIDNLEKVSTFEDLPSKLRFECKDLILYVESGKLSPKLKEQKKDMEINQIVL